MKTTGIVLASIGGLIALAIAFIYLSITQYPKIMAEYGPDIPVDAQAETRKAEAKLKAAPDDYSRWVALGNEVYWQSTQQGTDDVRAHAAELLIMAEGYKADWNYGNAIHKANSALGRIALRSGDKVGARKYLLASARSKGSPQMNSFGPNMGFAKEMLEAGEKDAVLEYLAMCRQFWDSGHGKIDVWAQMIGEGRSPKFGANLLF